MKLFLKQKIFSFKERFYIYDEWGNEKYYVEGELLSLGKRLHVYSAAGDELAFIKQKLFTFTPKYKIFIGGSEFAEVVKHFTLFKQHYSVIGIDWQVMGDFLDHEYEIYDTILPIAKVTKEWLSWADTYSIDIASGVNELEALCVVLVIDAALDEPDRF